LYGIDMPVYPANFLRVSPFRSLPGSERYWLTAEHDMLLVVTDGQLSWETGGTVREARAGDVVCHAADRSYLEWTRTDAPAAGCKIQMHWQHGRCPFAPVTHDHTGLIRIAAARLLAIWYEMESRGQTPKLRDSAHLIFHGIVGELIELNREETSSMLRALRDFVVRDPDRRIELADLAAHAGYEPSYYSRKFRAETGQSPMEAVRRCRLELARDLLLGSALSIKTIARQCGFTDGAHLSNHYRRAYHTTPSAARRAAGG
jgi:AraC-like DNA-binding protein